MEAIIEIDNVSFAYPGMPPVLQDINLLVQKGEFLAVTGPNGSAKTTLLKLILGLQTPQKGAIKLLGQSTRTLKEWHKVGYVPQKTAFFNSRFPAVVEEIVGLGYRPGPKGGEGKKTKRKRVREVLQTVELLEKGACRIGELSGGELQRVLIARSLLNDLEVLFLDEPTANLDVSARQKLVGLLLELNRNMAISVVLVTHDLTLIQRASRIIKVAEKSIAEVDCSDILKTSAYLTEGQCKWA